MLILLYIFIYLCGVDESILMVSLPHVKEHYGIDVEQLKWANVAFTIATCIFSVLTGRLLGNFKLHKVMAVVVTVFVSSTFLITIAPNIHVFALCRFLQAIGMGAAVPLTFTMIKKIVEPNKVGKSVTNAWLSLSIGLMTGPSIGGYILSMGSWQDCFNVIGLKSLVVGSIIVFRSLSVQSTPVKASIDKWSFFSFVGFVILLTMFASDKGFLLGSLSTFSFALLVFLCLTRKNSVLDLTVFKEKYIPIMFLMGVTTSMIRYAMYFVMPLILTHGLGFNAKQMGVCFTSALIVITSINLYGRSKVDNIPIQTGLAGSLLIQVAGIVMLSWLAPGNSELSVISAIVVFGIGVSFFPIFYNLAAIKILPENQVGSFSGLIIAKFNLGGSVGVALYGGIYSALTDIQQVIPTQASVKVFTYMGIQVISTIAAFWLYNRINGGQFKLDSDNSNLLDSQPVSAQETNASEDEIRPVKKAV